MAKDGDIIDVMLGWIFRPIRLDFGRNRQTGDASNRWSVHRHHRIV